MSRTGLVHRQVVQAGIDISRARLLDELKDIRQITNLYPPSGSHDRRGPGRPRAETIMSKTSDLQKRLGDALGITQFLDRSSIHPPNRKTPTNIGKKQQS